MKVGTDDGVLSVRDPEEVSRMAVLELVGVAAVLETSCATEVDMEMEPDDCGDIESTTSDVTVMRKGGAV